MSTTKTDQATDQAFIQSFIHADGRVPAKRPVLSVIGAGGKTTCLFLLSSYFRRQNKRVLLTTTTHMWQPSHHFASDADAICTRLSENGFCIAGTPETNGKISALSPEVRSKVYACSDVILIEADGSRGYPFKAPAPWEPVIDPATTCILLLAGMRAYGRPIREVCHRAERVQEILSCSLSHNLDTSDMARVLRSAYLSPLHRQYPHIPVKLIFTQADSPERLHAVGEIKKYLVKQAAQ